MSSRWPSSLLSSTNQQLTERIEQLSVELESKRSAVVEAREVVELIQKNQRQTQRQERAAAEALAVKRAAVERDEGALKQLQQEIEGTGRQVRRLQDEEVRVSSAAAALEASMELQRQRLVEEQSSAVTLEAEVKGIVVAHLARQRVGEELSAAQRELSSAVWVRLEKLNNRVRLSTQQLADARAEHQIILKELDAAQHSLREAVKDQSESLRALDLVHSQSSELDAHVVANAAAMEGLQRTAQEKAELRDRMRASLARFSEDNKQRAAARDHQRSRYDKQLHALREVVEGIREDEGRLTSYTGRHHAEDSCLQQQRRELDHIVRLCDEKAALLVLERERHAALLQTRAELDKQARTNTPAPAALRGLVLSLSRQKELLEERIARVQLRLGEAVQVFVQEGRRGDEVNAALSTVQQDRRVLVTSQESAESEAHLLRQRCGQLEELLAERRALLPSMEALAQERRAQRQEAWMRDIAELRTSLLRVQREQLLLRQGITTLNGSVHRTRRAQADGDASQGSALTALRLLEKEVLALEQEERDVVETARSCGLQHEQAAVGLQSLMKAADANVEVLKGTAGIESFLRAEVQIKEDQIQASMQGRLVELHLHENELHGLAEELQRHDRKLRLLRMRYEEVMSSLTRASQKPLLEEHSDAPPPLPPLGRVDSAADPETVHAHLLLRRSYEREHLMQRGNYLDLRLVALDRETTTLRHMLDGLRSSASSPPTAAEVFLTEKEVGRSGVLVSADPNALSAAAPAAVQPPCSTADVKDQLRSERLAKEHYWKLEVDLLEETMSVMSRERDRTRVQLAQLRLTLKELQSTEKQKRMRLQKLREAVERSHRQANAAAMRGIK